MHMKHTRTLPKQYVLAFVANNCITQEQVTENGLPGDIVSHQEKTAGKLKRGSENWYHFFAVLEILYMFNLTPANALRYSGSLFEEIERLVARSTCVFNAFKQCIPSTTAMKVRPYYRRMLEMIILPSYGRLKAGDVTRNLRARKRQATAARLATRKQILVASKNETT